MDCSGVAHLIVLPILNIYRKYYGLRMMGFLLVTSFAAMVGGALVIEVLFGAIGSIPETRRPYSCGGSRAPAA
jgi:uncharacterized protein